MLKTTRYKQASQTYQQTIDSVSLILNEQTGECFQFNRVGKCIFDLLIDSLTEEEIIQQLTRQFNIRQWQCKKTVGVYLRLLALRSLIEAT